MLTTCLALALSGFTTTGTVSTESTLRPESLAALTQSADPAPADKDKSIFSYTSVELGYSKTDIDTYDEDSDAIYGRASLGLSVGATYTMLEDDDQYGFDARFSF